MCNGSRARETFAIGAVLGCLLALVHADELDRHDGQTACTQINSQLEAEILAQRREILDLTAELESCQRGERKLKDHSGLELTLSPLSARGRGEHPTSNPPDIRSHQQPSECIPLAGAFLSSSRMLLAASVHILKCMIV